MELKYRTNHYNVYFTDGRFVVFYTSANRSCWSFEILSEAIETANYYEKSLPCNNGGIDTSI